MFSFGSRVKSLSLTYYNYYLKGFMNSETTVVTCVQLPFTTLQHKTKKTTFLLVLLLITPINHRLVEFFFFFYRDYHLSVEGK